MAWQDFIDIEFIKLNGKHMSGALVALVGFSLLAWLSEKILEVGYVLAIIKLADKIVVTCCIFYLAIVILWELARKLVKLFKGSGNGSALSSWSHRILTIWLQYLLIGVCAVPFAVLTLFLIRKGMQEQTAFLVAIGLTLAASYSLWRVVISSPQRATTAVLSGALVLAFVPLVLLFAAAAFIAFLETTFFGKSVALSRRPFTPKQPVDTTPPPKRTISN